MENIEPNFFVVNRGLIHSPRWLSEKFTRGQAWVDLFGLAQHTESFFRVRGIRVDVKRGQLAYSQLNLAKRWKWSRDKVRRYLSELEKDGDIIQQNSKITTLITIVKYDLWQGEPTPNKTTSNTTNRQQKNIKQDTYKQCIKNVKKDIHSTNKENLVNDFITLVREKRYFTYEPSPSDSKMLGIALSKTTPDEIKKIFVWYLTTDKSKEHCSISSALSTHTLNLYKEFEAKGSWNQL